MRREVVEHFEDRGPRDGFYTAVLNALPDRTRDAFEALSPREKAERFFTWVRQNTACRGDVTLEDLETFFAEELDAETLRPAFGPSAGRNGAAAAADVQVHAEDGRCGKSRVDVADGRQAER